MLIKIYGTAIEVDQQINKHALYVDRIAFIGKTKNPESRKLKIKPNIADPYCFKRIKTMVTEKPHRNATGSTLNAFLEHVAS